MCKRSHWLFSQRIMSYLYAINICFLSTSIIMTAGLNRKLMKPLYAIAREVKAVRPRNVLVSVRSRHRVQFMSSANLALLIGPSLGNIFETSAIPIKYRHNTYIKHLHTKHCERRQYFNVEFNIYTATEVSNIIGNSGTILFRASF